MQIKLTRLNKQSYNPSSFIILHIHLWHDVIHSLKCVCVNNQNAEQIIDYVLI